MTQWTTLIGEPVTQPEEDSGIVSEDPDPLVDPGQPLTAQPRPGQYCGLKTRLWANVDRTQTTQTQLTQPRQTDNDPAQPVELTQAIVIDS